LTDITAQRCFSIFCLGDTIGYGPEPAACVQYMREFAPINLMGNHEAMYLATKPRGKKITRRTPGNAPVTLNPDCRYAIGVGSVGQPRDDDPRACYVIYHPGSGRVEFRRVLSYAGMW